MNIKFYENNENRVLGITLKDPLVAEENNMALHVCQNEAHIIENRQHLASQLQTDLTQFVCANQTHSANFFRVEKSTIGSGAADNATAISNTDGLYTYEPNIVITSFSADCVPVLFYHENKCRWCHSLGCKERLKKLRCSYFNI